MLQGILPVYLVGVGKYSGMIPQVMMQVIYEAQFLYGYVEQQLVPCPAYILVSSLAGVIYTFLVCV